MTKQEELKIAWERFRHLPFPEHPNQNDTLKDLFADLVLIDGEAAEFVMWFLKGGKPLTKRIHIDEDYNSRLESSKPTDPDELKDWRAMKRYKTEIDKLITLLLATNS